MTSVLAFLVHHDGAFHPGSLGALTEAARLAGELGGRCEAVVVGSSAELPDELCRGLGAYGASRVHRAAGPSGLAPAGVDAMAAAMERGGHVYALLGGGVLGSEVAAGLASRLDAGLVVEVTSARVREGELVVERAIFGDARLSTVSFRSERGVVVTRAGTFEALARDRAPAEVVDLDLRLGPAALAPVLVARGEQRGAPAELEGADVIVAGGRGLGRPEGFRLLEELAGLLGGEVGATRAVVDMGWYPYSAQVGQTGKTVTPRLYIAAGISGAVQHKVGMQDAEHIISINRDPDAPILAFSHLGVVGDLHAIVPALTAALRARLGEPQAAAPLQSDEP